MQITWESPLEQQGLPLNLVGYIYIASCAKVRGLRLDVV